METSILITTQPGDRDIPYRYRVSPRPRLSRSHLISVYTEMRRMFAAELEIPAIVRRTLGNSLPNRSERDPDQERHDRRSRQRERRVVAMTFVH
jgi:hypothetical protein